MGEGSDTDIIDVVVEGNGLNNNEVKENGVTENGVKENGVKGSEGKENGGLAAIPVEELSSLSEEAKRKKGITKYGQALKTLIPIRCETKKKENLQNTKLGLFSYVSINWLDKWMWNSSRKGVQLEQLGKINERDSVWYNNRRLVRLWKEEVARKGNDASLVRVVWKFNRFPLTLAALLMVLTSVCAFVGPAWILNDLLDWVNDGDNDNYWKGWVLVVCMSFTQFLRNAAFSALWVVGAHAGIWAQGAIQVLVYEKVLTIKAGGEKLLAEVVNYSTTDIERIYQSMQLSMLIVGAPVMWIMNVVYCYLVLGPWSLLGNGLIICYYPIMAMVGRRTSALRVKAVRITDSRIRLMNQVLGSIKLIKMYAWEETFSEKIKDIRAREENILHKAAFLQSMSWTLSPILTVVAPMVSFIGKVLTGGALNSSDSFTLIAVFTSLLLPLNTLPMAVKSFSEGLVSCARIQKMLLTSNAVIPDSKHIVNPKHAIAMTNADLAWEGLALTPQKVQKMQKKIEKKLENRARRLTNTAEMSDQTPFPDNNVAESMDSLDKIDDRPTAGSSKATPKAPASDMITVLRDINLVVEKGQLIGICGNVGSGKTSLINTITGDTTVTKGFVSIQGKIALATQTAWIFNASVRDNILFGLPFDEKRYNMVVYASCLETDFTLMPHGDQTEIGEKGANLSGGQKQRINLARALYSDRDIFLLDDVLSAVDVKVSKHIFEHYVKRGLQAHGKTTLLVTHAMHLLERCDYIIMMKEGRIFERGTHEELISQNGDYALMFHTDQEERQKKKGSKGAAGADEEAPEPDEARILEGQMIKAEIEQFTGLSWNTWLFYCKQCGGYIISLLTFCTIILFNLATIFNSVWLQTWTGEGCGSNLTFSVYNESKEYYNDQGYKDEDFSNNGDCDNVTRNTDLHMYVAVYGASAVLMILFGTIKGLSVGKALLRGASNLHHKMFWKVIRSPMSFFDTTPLGRIINRFSRDMDELDVQIPFVSEFCSQSLMLIAFQLILICVYFYWYVIGLVVMLAAYLLFDTLLNGGVRATKRLDNILRPPLLVHIGGTVQGVPVIRCYEKQTMMAKKFRGLVDRHLSAYLLFQMSSKWIAYRIDTLSWLVITGTGIMVIFVKGTDSSSAAGLAMSQIFRVCAVLATVTRWKSELMARMISIERVADYCRNLVEEAPSIIKANRPDPSWPVMGAIEFKDAELRYRPDLPMVLHGLSVDIKGGEKVGIIGRTGAGKSSVVGTLLRLTELCGGSIVIDGMDISKIGLRDLRSKLAVIPQEPVLFEGTVRWNLDPFNERNDEQIWDSLEKAHLKHKIVKETAQLDTVLNAEGGIFSLGEKQLFCLARALLRNSKILLLDEATASVDVETDKLIQATIRDSFKSCTVLTIAHRLNTIADYEKIMAMDAGKVIEFDTPQNLLARDSLFASMMKSMNESGEH